MGVDGRHARRQRTRVHVLNEARRLIESRGSRSVTMSDVAQAAGVARRTVYDHFGSRAGLLLALAEHADEEIDLGERLAPVFAAPTAVEAIRRLVGVVADVTPGMLELATAFERARVEDADANVAWEDRMADRMQACLALASRLDDEGSLREEVTAQEAADLLYAAISWQQWQLLVEERGWTPEQWTARTRDLLERALT